MTTEVLKYQALDAVDQFLNGLITGDVDGLDEIILPDNGQVRLLAMTILIKYKLAEFVEVNNPKTAVKIRPEGRECVEMGGIRHFLPLNDNNNKSIPVNKIVEEIIELYSPDKNGDRFQKK